MTDPTDDLIEILVRARESGMQRGTAVALVRDVYVAPWSPAPKIQEDRLVEKLCYWLEGRDLPHVRDSSIPYDEDNDGVAVHLAELCDRSAFHRDEDERENEDEAGL